MYIHHRTGSYPGKGLPPPGFELPPFLRRARQLNLIRIRKIREGDPVISMGDPVIAMVLQQELDDSTYAHTVKKTVEQQDTENQQPTEQMQRELGSITIAE